MHRRLDSRVTEARNCSDSTRLEPCPASCKNAGMKPLICLCLLCCLLFDSDLASAAPANPLFEHYSLHLSDAKKRWFAWSWQPEANDEGAFGGWSLDSGYVRHPRHWRITDLTAWGTHYRADVLNTRGLGMPDERLHSLRFPLIWMHRKVNRRYWFTATPALYTDGHRLTSDDVTGHLSGLAIIDLPGTAQGVLGIQYDRSLGDDKAYPVLGVVWNPAFNVEVRAVFPEPRIVWAPSENTALFVESLQHGGRWSVGSADHIALRSRRYQFGVSWHWEADRWLEAILGWETQRQLEIQEPQLTRQYRPSDQWLLSLRLIFR